MRVENTDVWCHGMRNIPPVQRAARKAKVRCIVTLNVIEKDNLSENNCRRLGEPSHQAVETLKVVMRVHFVTRKSHSSPQTKTREKIQRLFTDIFIVFPNLSYFLGTKFIMGTIRYITYSEKIIKVRLLWKYVVAGN